MSKIDLEVEIVKTEIDLTVTTEENTMTLTIVKYENVNNFVRSVLTNEPSGATKIENAVSISQIDYDAGTKNGTTLYIIPTI